MNWANELPKIIKCYNTSPHHSLRAGHWYDRVFYTSDQVYYNPEVRRRQKIHDYLRKYKGHKWYKNYDWYRKYYKPDTMVHYRVMPVGLHDKGKRGYLSLYLVVIRNKIG